MSMKGSVRQVTEENSRIADIEEANRKLKIVDTTSPTGCKHAGIIVVRHEGNGCGACNSAKSEKSHWHLFCDQCKVDWIIEDGKNVD